MPFLTLSTGATLHYDDVGDISAFPVIAIHGWLGTGRAHLSHVMDWLVNAGFRVIAPTRRGYGQSLPKPRDYPVDFYHRDAKDMLALMEALNIQKAHLLGFSDGGETGMIMAGFAPQKFEKVVVWGAVGYYAPSMRAIIQRSYPATWMSQEVRDLNGLADQAAADALVLGWINAVKHMIDAGGDVSVSLAPQISASVLMLLGEDDALNAPSSARVFLDRVADGRLEMFACGHPVHEERWDDFRRVVGAFLGIKARG